MEASFSVTGYDPAELIIIIVRFLVTLLGSVTMYVFSFSRGFKGSMIVIKRLFPERKKVFYDRLDFLLVVFLGSAIGTVFFSPQDNFQALAAGCGWVGAVSVLLNRGEKEMNPDDE